MIKPIYDVDLDYCLKVNSNYKITHFQNGILVIDDWYENFEALQKFVQEATPGMWSNDSDEWFDGKWFPFHRIKNTNYEETMSEILKLIKQYFNCDGIPNNSDMLNFNYFKLFKEQKINFQQLPHKDDNPFAAVIYIDNICDGGTEFYREKYVSQSNEDFLTNIDELEYTVKLEPFVKIKSTPNRLVLSPSGSIFHGGYFDNINSYLNDWRITQVCFLDTVEEQ